MANMTQSRKTLPTWWRVLEEFVPCAPTACIHKYQCGEQEPRYHIGGDGWVDGGRDAAMYTTKLAAIIATKSR